MSTRPLAAPILEFDTKRFALVGSAEALDASSANRQGFHGLYKRAPNGVNLYRPSGDLEAFIVTNRHNERFVVSAYMHEGSPRYMFGAANSTEKWLGIADVGMLETDRLIREMTFKPSPAQVDQAVRSIELGNDERLAEAVRQAGYSVIASTDLHGKPTFKGFTAAAQAALAVEEFGQTTYRSVTAGAHDEPDFEAAILARGERMREGY